MFKKIFEKLASFADHHQAFFALVIGLSIIFFTWGVEKLLEHYLWPNRKPFGYIIALVGGLLILWLTKHFILHAI